MKICPNCLATFPEGFQYCPNDTEALLSGEEFSQLKSEPLSPTESPILPVQRMISQVTQPISQVKDPLPTTARSDVIGTEPAAAKPTGPISIPQPPGGSPGLTFSIPQQNNLFVSLVTAVQQFWQDFGKKSPTLRPGDTGDFTFLLNEESLASRLGRELTLSFEGFKQDPGGFTRELVRGEGRNRFRRDALLAGSELALVGYVTLYLAGQIISGVRKDNPLLINSALIALALWLGGCLMARGLLLYRIVNRFSRNLVLPKLALEGLTWGPFLTILLLSILLNPQLICRYFPFLCPPVEVAKVEQVDITMIEPVIIPDAKAEKVPKEMKGKGGFTGGSKAKIEQAKGGGGGGAETKAPASKGVPPKMSLIPPPLPPSVTPPKIKNPTLVVPNLAMGDPKALPDLKGPIGDLKGVEGPPAPGSGKNGGIGSGSEGGVGGGTGRGVGPGRAGNTGGGENSIGGGPPGNGSGGIVPYSALTTKPVVLYKEKAKYTEEARQNKIQGVVVVSLVVTADGGVANIRVIRGLPDGLTEKAIEAAQHMKFKPATKNGDPVATKTQVEFSFNIY